MRYFIITDIQYRKAFDVISIIKKEFPHEQLILASHKNVFFSFLCYGSCVTEKLRTENGYEVFCRDFAKLLEKHESEELVYVPVEEQTTDLVINYIEAHGKRNLTCLLPSAELYKQFRNKKKLNDYCLENNLAAPKQYLASELPNVEYPVLIKPEIGSGSHGIYRLYSAADYNEEIKAALSREKYIIQELLPNGKDVKGAFFLCHKGKVIGAYTHKRIRTSPEEGGVTVLSSMYDNPQLIEQGKELLEKAGWEGLIMLEFLYDERCGQYKVIEANPRLWGSIMLSEFAGANLLSNYIRICIGEPTVAPNIKKDVYIRWLFPMDLLNLIRKKGRIKGFWNFKNTCFINWTYARKDRAIFFIIFSIFNLENIKKLLHRV
jgi:predicted ATP-grasp superfamily ATP-dependent carboligase